MAIILQNEKKANDIFKMKIAGDFKGKQGQFYMLKSANTFLNRPISIHDIDSEGITFLYQVKGDGTSYFSKLKRGNEINLYGPLGNYFELPESNLTLIGGGIGTAPLYLVAKRFKEKYPNRKLTVYLGFTKESYETEIYENLADEIHVDVGGIITDEVTVKDDETYFCCGPEIMMRSAWEKIKNDQLYVSLESKMACGVGACLGCNIETKKGNKKVCKDGPVFKAMEVYDE